MAELSVTFEKVSIHNGTLTTESWVDLTSTGPDINSPIPSGKQIWIGLISFVSWDKPLTIEIRPNLATKALGTDAETQLRGFATIPKEDSKDVDFDYWGKILTLAPVSVASTGVEKVWLKIKSGSGAVGEYDCMLYYSLY